jgi:hypothetical protein
MATPASCGGLLFPASWRTTRMDKPGGVAGRASAVYACASASLVGMQEWSS